MALVGMDTDLATTQASQLQTQGVDALQSVITAVENIVGQITGNWQGNDATNFHNEWQTSHRTQLMGIHDALTTFHTTFTHNITEQINTSAR